jgi:RNA polymerase sigma-70 factor (ECF subfamily)
MDHESFTVLFEQYHKKIFSLAFRMCGNREDADDIVQGTFIQAFANIDRFKEESGIYTWLYTIAKNQCLRLLQNRKRSSVSLLEKLIQTAQSQQGEDHFEAAERQDYINQVKDGCLLGLLRCLPFNQRIAFILNVLLDVKVKDISRLLGKSEAAARMLIHHARQNIKEFLCKNCSLYKSDNPCHCENLIQFSLQHGWIRITAENGSYRQTITPLEIERELNDLKKITMLYRSLEDHQPSEKMIDFIQEEINKQTFRIFDPKKVK